jgi:hypothetical protein
MIKLFTGHSGVLLLMLLTLASAGWVHVENSKSDAIRLSVDFKSYRRLEYQEWVSRDSLSDYQELDEVSADLLGPQGRQGILLKALPTLFTELVGGENHLSFRMQNALASESTSFLLAPTESSRILAELNKELIENKFNISETSWHSVELNGRDQGLYLKVTWPTIAQLQFLSWSSFKNIPKSSDRNLLLQKIFESRVPEQQRESFSIGGEKSGDKFSAAFIIPQALSAIDD